MPLGFILLVAALARVASRRDNPSGGSAEAAKAAGGGDNGGGGSDTDSPNYTFKRQIQAQEDILRKELREQPAPQVSMAVDGASSSSIVASVDNETVKAVQDKHLKHMASAALPKWAEEEQRRSGS